MYLVSPYTWYAREDSRGLNVIPIRDGHTPPPDAVQLPTDLSDMALTHYNLSGATNRYYQQADGRPLFRWLCQLERAICDTLTGTFPTDTPTAEEVARRAAVAATVVTDRAARAALEAERVRRDTVMYVFIDPDTHDLHLIGTWNDLYAAQHYVAPPDTSCYLTAPDLPAGITNDQLLRCRELGRKIDEAMSFTDGIRRTHREQGFDSDSVTFHDPVLMALIKERDTLRNHFADTMSAHHRRRHALLAWGVSHCGWAVA
jgi:hypothetical protein